MKIFFGCLFFIVCIRIIPTLHAQEYQEQVIAGELPDPSIIKVEDEYYAVGSSNDWGPIYPIYKSKDLKNWSFLNYVFDEKPDWTISSFWAPELFYYKNTFYCYYTASRTDGTSMIGVATTENIDEGFNDSGPLLEWGDEAIDPFVYNEKGKLYITWKAYGLTPDKPIQILGSELSDDGLELRGEHFEILTADEDTWEKGGIEGQSIIKKGDYLYIFYAGNACCGEDCNYQIGVARSNSMKGDWEKYESNPILKSNERWKCPGHGTPIEVSNNEYFYLYHAYPSYGFPYLGRSAVLSELEWDVSGWPKFKEKKEVIDSLESLKANIYDNFSKSELGYWWRYDIPNKGMDVSIRNNKLTITENDSINNKAINSFIGVDPEYADFIIQTKVGMNNKSEKGLSVYVTEENSIGVGVTNNKLMLWKIKDGELRNLNNINIDDSKQIHLKGKIKNGHNAEFYYKYDDESWRSIENVSENSTKIIGDNLSWWSWGIKAGLYLKNKNQGNKAIFDEFRIEYPEI